MYAGENNTVNALPALVAFRSVIGGIIAGHPDRPGHPALKSTCCILLATSRAALVTRVRQPARTIPPSATADKQGAIALYARMWRRRNDAMNGPAGQTPVLWVSSIGGDTMANHPKLFLRSTDHLKNHRDSVARRLRARELRAAYAKLRSLSETEQPDDVDCFDEDDGTPAKIHPRGEAWLHSRNSEFRPCPLGQQWFEWKCLIFSLTTDEERRRCSAARRPAR